MDNKVKAFRAVALVFVVLALGSCASYGPSRLPSQAYGDPATDTLVFGYLGNRPPLSLGVSALPEACYIQVNPDHEAARLPAYRPQGNSGVFYLQPMPAGSSLKLWYYKTYGSRSVTTYLQGILGKNDYDPVLAEPGLLYIGAFVLYNKFDSGDGEPYGFRLWKVEDEGHELEALESMRLQFRNTAWGPLIQARIEELKK